MKAVALYHPEGEYSTAVEDFAKNLKSRSGLDMELVSLETKEGSYKAQVYGVTEYPAVLVLTDEGNMQKLWQGSQLPLVDEVASYLIA